MRLTIIAAAFALAMAGQASAAAAPWAVGSHVSVYVSGSCCYNGVVIGEGSGSMAGYYLIHFDNPASHDQYAKADNVVALRPAPGAATAGKSAPPPRDPKIHCVMGTIGGKPACLPTAKPG